MSSAIYRFDSYVLDCGARELRRDGVPVVLPARTLECLQTLIEARDRAVGRDELARAVFSRDNVSDAQLGQIVLRARRAVGDDGQEQRCIRTVPRFGFRWVGEIAHEAAATPQLTAEPTPAVAAPASEPKLEPASVRVPARVGVGTAARARARIGRDGAGGLLAAAIAVALLTTLGAWWALTHRPWTSSEGLLPVSVERVDAAVIVLPTIVTGSDAASWARFGLMDYIGDRLRRSGMAVPPTDSVLALLHGAASSEARSERARQAAGHGWTVTSAAYERDGVWHVEVGAEDAEGGRRRGAGADVQLLQAADVATSRLLAALGSPDPGDDAALALTERLQRAQAAILGNELDTARSILEAAPEQQRAEPQLLLRLVQVDFREGKYRESLAQVDRLLDTDTARDDSAFRARAHMTRGAINVRLDRYHDGERDYDDAIGLLDSESQAALLGSALMGRGITRSALGDFDRALEDLGQARILLTRTGDPLSVARVDANLGHLEVQRARPAQAVEFFARAATEFERYDAVHEVVSVQATLAMVHLQLLQPERARASVERAWSWRDRIADRTQSTHLALVRAEVLMRQGEFDAAEALLDLHGDGPVLPGDLHRVDALRVALARGQGEAEAALAIADAALDRWSEDAWRSRHLEVRLAREEIALQLGRAPRQEVERETDGVAGDAGGAAPSLSALLDAALARTGDQAPQTVRTYRRALTRAEDRGVPREIADVVLAYVPWLLEQGALQDAIALSGRIAPWARHDFDLALLQVRLFHTLGQRSSWEAALQDARRLAGERDIPDTLVIAPLAAAPDAGAIGVAGAW